METRRKERLVAVDAFRGLIMARIVLIPLHSALQTLPPGAVRNTLIAQLQHSRWHGLTAWDFTFAGFVMVVGLSVRLALKRYKDDRTQRRAVYAKILKRSLILFLLGLLYNGGFTETWPNIRLCGVLQRLAICYLFASVVYLHTTVRQRAALAAVILLGYWGILAWVPFPGGTAGDYSMNANLVWWIDSQLIPGEMFFGSWDPEGILSTLPAFASAIIGILWGDLLLSDKSSSEKAIWLFAAGIVAINIGVLWDSVFPINKPLWTSSYVMVTSGIGSALLGLCVVVADVLQWKWLLFPLVVVGRNLLVVFLAMRFISLHSVATALTGGNIAEFFGPAAPFIHALTEAGLLWGFLLFLYKKNIVIKV